MNRYMEAAVAYLGYPLMAFRRWRLHSGRERGESRNILILRPDRIGDFVVTTPFLREVRRNFPTAHITLVASPACYELAAPCPYVDEVLTYQKAYKRHKYMSNYKAAWTFAKEHFQRRYDIAMIPGFAVPDAYAEGWLAYYSGAKRRIAYTEKVSESKHHWYMGSLDLYQTELVADSEEVHEVESALRLLRAMNLRVDDHALELWPEARDERRVLQLLRESGVNEGKKKLLLNLSTSNREKDYPVEKYVCVMKYLRSKYDFELLLIGAGRDARQYRDEFVSAYRGEYYDLVEKTKLPETVALMHMSDYYLGGDTGPMHMAAEAGLGGVVLYKDAEDMEGILPSRVFAPWQSPLKILRPEHNMEGCERGCHRESHCIRQISETAVAEAMGQAMSIG